MAIFEVEDTYLDQLRAAGVPLRDASQDYRKAKDHETFINGVSQNPKTRQKLLELIADTGTYVPEIEAAKPVLANVDRLEKKFDDYLESEKKRREEEAEQRRTQTTEQLIDGGRKFLRGQGWDDDGVKEVETFMRDNSVGSYEVASKYLRAQKPDPTPLPTSSWNGNDLGSSWFQPPDDAPDHKLLLKDPAAFSNQEIAKFFREKREGRLNINQ